MNKTHPKLVARGPEMEEDAGLKFKGMHFKLFLLEFTTLHIMGAYMVILRGMVFA